MYLCVLMCSSAMVVGVRPMPWLLFEEYYNYVFMCGSNAKSGWMDVRVIRYPQQQ